MISGDAWRFRAFPQEPRRRGEIDLSVGVVDGDLPYMFDDVGALARDTTGRIYVADSGAREVRAFDADGNFLHAIGGPGEGPGDFVGSILCGLAFDPEGRLWVNQRISLKIFAISAAGAEYVDEVRIQGGKNLIRCGNPMFVGPTGITVPRGDGLLPGWTTEHLHVAMSGEVLGRVENVKEFPEFGEWTYPVIVVRRHANGEVERIPFPPPFAARSLVAHSPDGSFAHVFSPVYDIRLYSVDGELKGRVRRDLVGPIITDAEVRRGNEELAETRGAFPARMVVDFPGYEIPERKPVINRLWYDDDGRLWVFLWPGEADTMYRAHVYSEDGAFLHVAEWPRGIGIWYGGVSGDVALGLQLGEFDVQEVVRLRFSPVPPLDSRRLR